MKRISFILLPLLIFFSTAYGQMDRKRAQTDDTINEMFWAPNIVGMGTVEHLPSGNLNVTIMHTFGIVTDKPINNFFGLDDSPNVRLGIDYGITDSWSLGIGRTTTRDVVDIRSKIALLKQTKSGDVPLSLSLKGDVGVKTIENNRPMSDDLSFFVSLPVARKFGENLTLQVTPMLGHHNAVFAGQVNSIFALGLGGQYKVSDRYALISEYYPVIGDRPVKTKNAFSLGLNIETGGHVFQLFFASSNWHNEQYILLNNEDDFWAGDFRFGFNVNRVFFLKK